MGIDSEVDVITLRRDVQNLVHRIVEVSEGFFATEVVIISSFNASGMIKRTDVVANQTFKTPGSRSIDALIATKARNSTFDRIGEEDAVAVINFAAHGGEVAGTLTIVGKEAVGSNFLSDDDLIIDKVCADTYKEKRKNAGQLENIFVIVHFVSSL